MEGWVRDKGLDERTDFGREVFEEKFVLAEVGEEEEVTGEEEEGSAGLGVLVLVEVAVEEGGYLEFVVEVVGHAVVGHVADLFRLQLQVLEGVLEVVQVHLLITPIIYINTPY